MGATLTVPSWAPIAAFLTALVLVGTGIGAFDLIKTKLRGYFAKEETIASIPGLRTDILALKDELHAVKESQSSMSLKQEALHAEFEDFAESMRPGWREGLRERTHARRTTQHRQD